MVQPLHLHRGLGKFHRPPLEVCLCPSNLSIRSSWLYPALGISVERGQGQSTGVLPLTLLCGLQSLEEGAGRGLPCDRDRLELRPICKEEVSGFPGGLRNPETEGLMITVFWIMNERSTHREIQMHTEDQKELVSPHPVTSQALCRLASPPHPTCRVLNLTFHQMGLKVPHHTKLLHCQMSPGSKRNNHTQTLHTVMKFG